MRECPECKRVYYDETLNYCLEDGTELVYGPATNSPSTAILTELPSEAPTRHQPVAPDQSRLSSEYPTKAAAYLTRNKLYLAVLVPTVLAISGLVAYRNFYVADRTQIDSIAVMPFVNASEIGRAHV